MLLLLLACAKESPKSVAAAAAAACSGCAADQLVSVGDVALPGDNVRFDYQDIDSANGHLIIAHMNDDSVDIMNLSDGSLAAELTDIRTARGIAVGSEAGMIFVTSSPDQVVRIDSTTLTEIDRVTCGSSPDGIAWDGDDGIVGVSDQGDGAITLLPDDGAGAGMDVALGDATGNVTYDATRGWFWITVEHSSTDDQVVAIDPTTGDQKAAFDLPGCSAAHGLKLHPDAASAFIACEGNNVLARVDLSSGDLTTAGTTGGPDVLSIDAELGWLYLAAEGGALGVYDISSAGVTLAFNQDVGDNAHTVQVDPATHYSYFPLEDLDGEPTLRIMQPGSSE